MKAEIHWNKQKKLWTIHTYKGCEWAANILVKGNWFTEVKPLRKTNPRGWVVADRKQVEIIEDNLDLPKGEQLFYDKINKVFNRENGTDLLFLPEGAFLTN